MKLVYSLLAVPCFLTGSGLWRTEEDGSITQLTPPRSAGVRLMIVDQNNKIHGEAFWGMHGTEFVNEAEALRCYESCPVAKDEFLPSWNAAIRPMVRNAFALEEKYRPKGFSLEEWLESDRPESS